MPKTTAYTDLAPEQAIEIKMNFPVRLEAGNRDTGRQATPGQDNWAPHIMERAMALLSGLLADGLEESPVARSLERNLIRYRGSAPSRGRVRNSLDIHPMDKASGESFDVKDALRELAEARKCFVR